MNTFPALTSGPVAADGEPNVVTYSDFDYRSGLPGKMTNEMGYATTYVYDGAGRTLQIDHPDGGRETFSYDQIVQPYSTTTRIRESADSTVDAVSWFDGFGRQVQHKTYGEGGAPVLSRTLYNPVGLLAHEQGPYFGSGDDYDPPPDAHFSVYTEYDFRGRPTAVYRSGNEITRFEYSGFATTITDPELSVKKIVKNYLGRVVRVEESLGETLNRAPDAPLYDPMNEPGSEPGEDPVREPPGEPVEEPASGPVDDPAWEPYDDPLAEPVEPPAEEPVDEPDDGRGDAPPAESPAELPVGSTSMAAAGALDGRVVEPAVEMAADGPEEFATTSYSYNISGDLVEITDSKNNRITFEFD
ncbi:MAG: hypothetical protein GY859_27210, partial [Desulfobacterales bacterium]|nr:hypothetical protein [Desulfobacterales bacterium]